MTEEEWLAYTDPRPMLGYLQDGISPRKARLFGVACCRLVSTLFVDEGSPNAIEVAERFADELATDEERSSAWSSIGMGNQPSLSEREKDSSWEADSAAETVVMGAYPDGQWYKAAALVARYVVRAIPESLPVQTAILRCNVGNPFRPVAFSPEWRTPTVLALANGIYTERAFDRLPILADALEETGCDHADILSHARGPGPHVRGCWVVDLVLGKE